MPISGETAIVIGLDPAVPGFVWNLHRDLADLRERMARLEGRFEGFARCEGGANRKVESRPPREKSVERMVGGGHP